VARERNGGTVVGPGAHDPGPPRPRHNNKRVEFIRAEVQNLENVEVESFANLIVDFAKEKGAHAIVKGLRAISDFEYEFEMNQLNAKMAPDIESIYMMSSAQYSFLSSSGVKELAMFGGDLTDLVTPAVAAHLEEALKR
jgi:pantetheine-phosphate adenylyltransferase